MLRLNLSTEPRWLDLGHGVRRLVDPLTTSIMLAARSDPRIVAAAGDPEGVASNDDLARIVAKSLARIVVRDWEDVGNGDGKPLPITHEGIDALLELWPIFEAFQTRYIAGALILDAEKGLTALADWECGGGGEYCAACPSLCAECPRSPHAPLTLEGWQVWDLVQRLGGQVRLAGGMSSRAVIGWDMAAALQLGAALGLSPLIIGELFPQVETLMVRRINEQAGSGSLERLDT
jgi:hypothetical protein